MAHNFEAQAQDLPASPVNAVIQATREPGLTVELTGQAIENVRPHLAVDVSDVPPGHPAGALGAASFTYHP